MDRGSLDLWDGNQIFHGFVQVRWRDLNAEKKCCKHKKMPSAIVSTIADDVDLPDLPRHK